MNQLQKNDLSLGLTGAFSGFIDLFQIAVEIAENGSGGGRSRIVGCRDGMPRALHAIYGVSLRGMVPFQHRRVSPIRHFEWRQRFEEKLLRRHEPPQAFIGLHCGLQDRGNRPLMDPHDLQQSKSIIDGFPTERVGALSPRFAAAQEIVEERGPILSGKQDTLCAHVSKP